MRNAKATPKKMMMVREEIHEVIADRFADESAGNLVGGLMAVTASLVVAGGIPTASAIVLLAGLIKEMEKNDEPEKR